MNEGSVGEKWYEQTWVIVLFLVFFWPVGLFLMWKFADWKKAVKTIVTVAIAAFMVLWIFIGLIIIGFVAYSKQSEFSDASPIENIDTENRLADNDFDSILDDQGEIAENDTTGQNDETVDESDERFARLNDLQLHFDDRQWELDYQEEEMGMMIREYVPEGESVEAWTELVTAQFFPDLQEVAPKDFAAMMEENLKAGISGKLEWNVFNEKDDGIMYEFILSDDDEHSDQHEVARMITVEDGVYVLHYAINEAPMADENHREWVDLLQKVTVKN